MRHTWISDIFQILYSSKRSLCISWWFLFPLFHIFSSLSLYFKFNFSFLKIVYVKLIVDHIFHWFRGEWWNSINLICVQLYLSFSCSRFVSLVSKLFNCVRIFFFWICFLNTFWSWNLINWRCWFCFWFKSINSSPFLRHYSTKFWVINKFIIIKIEKLEHSVHFIKCKSHSKLA